MSKVDKEYHNLLEKILQEGYIYEDPNRKSVNRIEIPSFTFRHEFKDGFPAITTKKLNYKSVVTELIWFLRGDTNIKYLVDNGCNIWNKNAYNYYIKQNPKGTKEEFNKGIHELNHIAGDLGAIYGAQWRKFGFKFYSNTEYLNYGVDQISNLIKGLKEKPLGTQHIVNAWNVLELDDMALQPCHYGFQVVVRPLHFDEKLKLFYNKGYLSGDTVSYNDNDFEIAFNGENIPKYGFELHWSQRSVDTFLGLPFNIASYATLALIIEKITGYKALGIQGDLKKVHLYDNSLDAVKEQLSRDVDKYDKCELKFDNSSYKSGTKYKDIDMFLDKLYPEDFELINYKSYPHIKVEMLERDE